MFDFYTRTVTFGLGSATGLFALAMFVLVIIGQWRMFEKAGKPGWGTLIPIYNTYCLFDMAFGNGWAMLFLLIPIVNVVVGIVALVKIAQAFGQSGLFQLMTVLFSGICFLILGYGSAEYIGPGGRRY
ncbi:MAG: hypothetical protein EOM69_03795 [Clostridia bacterium]|nr:hypothetical protein [Clostridia bacterium]